MKPGLLYVAVLCGEVKQETADGEHAWPQAVASFFASHLKLVEGIKAVHEYLRRPSAITRRRVHPAVALENSLRTVGRRGPHVTPV
jgi:hypothetical protein